MSRAVCPCLPVPDDCALIGFEPGGLMVCFNEEGELDKVRAFMCRRCFSAFDTATGDRLSDEVVRAAIRGGGEA